ncbi:hypothetical protein [Desemzia sp. C1]|nr:hypothetical protein [Desemzia sp. C1]
MGAIMIAAVVARCFSSLKSCVESLVNYQSKILPDPETVKKYD